MLQSQLDGMEKDWPNKGDSYWYVEADGDIVSENWDGIETEIKKLFLGNVFLTKQEAEYHLERLKSLRSK